MSSVIFVVRCLLCQDVHTFHCLFSFAVNAANFNWEPTVCFLIAVVNPISFSAGSLFHPCLQALPLVGNRTILFFWLGVYLHQQLFHKLLSVIIALYLFVVGGFFHKVLYFKLGQIFQHHDNVIDLFVIFNYFPGLKKFFHQFKPCCLITCPECRERIFFLLFLFFGSSASCRSPP